MSRKKSALVLISFVVVAFLFEFFISGGFGDPCGAVFRSESADGGAPRGVGVPGYIDRFIDSEAGVVCWMFTLGGGVGQGGMSCLPLDQTQLMRR